MSTPQAVGAQSRSQPWPVLALNSGNWAEPQGGSLEGERRGQLHELILKDGHVLLCSMHVRTLTHLPAAINWTGQASLAASCSPWTLLLCIVLSPAVQFSAHLSLILPSFVCLFTLLAKSSWALALGISEPTWKRQTLKSGKHWAV